jgi:aconitate hydratase
MRASAASSRSRGSRRACAPGSRVVTDYLTKAGLLATSKRSASTSSVTAAPRASATQGPLRPEISEGVRNGDVVADSVLSGNRNFEGRVHPEIKMNFLASPPLVVAYALAGTMNIDMNAEPIGTDSRRQAGLPEGHLAVCARSRTVVGASVDSAMFKKSYSSVFTGDEQWQAIERAAGRGLCAGSRQVDLRAQPAVLRTA